MPSAGPVTIGPALAASLDAIAHVMAGAQDRWWIIASAAVALHGADPGPVGDVDVLLSLADARRILPAIGVGLGQGSAHAAFRSRILGSWSGTRLPVEFMAGFDRREGAAWVPVWPATRRAVRLATATVFVPGRAELQAMLMAFGRPKDIERARRLAAAA